MGTARLQRLTDDEIVARYNAGESQSLIGLRARLSTAQVRAVLVGLGVRIRPSAETLRLTLRTRPRKPQTRPTFKGDA